MTSRTLPEASSFLRFRDSHGFHHHGRCRHRHFRGFLHRRHGFHRHCLLRRIFFVQDYPQTDIRKTGMFPASVHFPAGAWGAPLPHPHRSADGSVRPAAAAENFRTNLRSFLRRPSQARSPLPRVLRSLPQFSPSELSFLPAALTYGYSVLLEQCGPFPSRQRFPDWMVSQPSSPAGLARSYAMDASTHQP